VVRGPVRTDTRAPASETRSSTILEVGPTTDSYSASVHGNVASSFGEDQEFVQVVVARDASRKIIGADAGYVARLPSGGTAQFEARFLEPMPGGTKHETYAVL